MIGAATSWLRRHAPGVRLFLLVFLTLYAELALIRYTSAEVLYLGYFSNFILISAFLGIGTGFLLAEKKVNLFGLLPQLIFFLIAFITITRIDATTFRDEVGQLFFGHASRGSRISLIFCLLLIFGLSAAIFAAIAQETGRCFKHYKPLVAYSIDIGGSLLGILVFTVQSYLRGHPIFWFALIFLLIAVLSRERSGIASAILMGLAVILTIVAVRPDHYQRWSPYQRIDVFQEGAGFQLQANGVGHQAMMPVGMKEPVYDYPYTEVVEERGGAMFEHALIIGAGSGNDVAYALHYGVQSVDAVEIDPVIWRAGVNFHPAAPYDDPRVHTTITDGRAFMEHTDARYDLIVFALPDSLASFSSLSNIRLESFLFTVDSFRQAQALLEPDGVLVLYNYYRRDWLVDKLAAMLGEVFGHPPQVRTYTDESGGRLSALAIGPTLSGEPITYAGPLATDDWPFLYMEDEGVPPTYILIMLLFIGCGLIGVVATGHGAVGKLRENGPFFLMGAAFLLLETKSIIQFSLLFGATWLVNSLVFGAILISVLAANWIVTKLDIRSPAWMFLLLLAALGAQMAIPIPELLSIENTALRYTLASLLLFSPIFFANLVFGVLFRDTPKSASAFGWNLIGTMVGGALEYTSLAIGYHSLTFVVAGLYLLCAVWALRLRPRSQPEAAAAPLLEPGQAG